MPIYTPIETVTTGLFDFKRPADAPGQPRLAKLIMCRDFYGSESYMIRVVRPDGWEMSAEASQASGITTDDCRAYGEPIADVLRHYIEAVQAGHIIVAYNAAYHCKIMRAELRRAGFPDMIAETQTICLMRACMPFNIPKANGKKGFPAITDAVRFFGEPMSRADSEPESLSRVTTVMDGIMSAGGLPEPQTLMRD